MGRAKGTAFFHDEEYVKQTYGPDAWARVLAAMPAAAAEVRSSIVAVGWYDDTLLVETLRTVEEVLRERDPRIIETLGRFAAEQDLTRIHRVFLRMASPAFVLERATNLWRRFFDSGRWEVKPAEGGVDGLLIDSAIVHDVFCRNLQGYLQRLFELVGAKDVTVGHPECRVQGGALCRFAIRWT
ncbi:MAG TPA: hypothetical protein VF765_28680 [Polyangiaceae bacterium]